MELQYYSADTRGGRPQTTTICCICYSERDIATKPVCKFCLDLNIKLPGGRTDYMKEAQLKQAQKSSLNECTIEKGRKKRKKKRS